jgi:hypothetical protein
MTKLTLTDEEKAVLRSSMCLGWPEPFIQEFVKRCEATGLSPFRQQVYGRLQSTKEDGQYVKKLVVMTSIGALRSMAEGTGRFRGRTEPLFAGDELIASHQIQEDLRAHLRELGRQVMGVTDQAELTLAKAKQEAVQEVLDRESKNEAGIWKAVWTGGKPPFAAKVGVRSVDAGGHEHVTYHTAKFSAYVQTNREGKAMGLWAGELRDNQLAKCAEAGALRAAFPDELGGVYTADEMANKLAPSEQEELVKIQDVAVRGPRPADAPGERRAASDPLAPGVSAPSGGARRVSEPDRPMIPAGAGKGNGQGSPHPQPNGFGREDGLGVPWDYGAEGNPLDVHVSPHVSRVTALHGKPLRELSTENLKFFGQVSVRGTDPEKVRFYRAVYQVNAEWDKAKPFEEDVERVEGVLRGRVDCKEVVHAKGGSIVEQKIEEANRRQSYGVDQKPQELVTVEKVEIVGRAVKVRIGQGTVFVPQSKARDTEDPGKVAIPKWLYEEKQAEAVGRPQRRGNSVQQ